jgi:hypothetical protein
VVWLQTLLAVVAGRRATLPLSVKRLSSPRAGGDGV